MRLVNLGSWSNSKSSERNGSPATNGTDWGGKAKSQSQSISILTLVVFGVTRQLNGGQGIDEASAARILGIEDTWNADIDEGSGPPGSVDRVGATTDGNLGLGGGWFSMVVCTGDGHAGVDLGGLVSPLETVKDVGRVRPLVQRLDRLSHGADHEVSAQQGSDGLSAGEKRKGEDHQNGHRKKKQRKSKEIAETYMKSRQPR